MSKNNIVLNLSYYCFIFIVLIPSVLVVLLGDFIRGVGWAETFVLIGLILFPSIYIFSLSKKIKQQRQNEDRKAQKSLKLSFWNYFTMVLSIISSLVFSLFGLMLFQTINSEAISKTGDTMSSGMGTTIFVCFLTLIGSLSILFYCIFSIIEFNKVK